MRGGTNSLLSGLAPRRTASMIHGIGGIEGRRVVTWSLRSVLILVAVILFVISAVGAFKADFDLLALGLAFFAAAFIVPERGLGRM